MLTPFQMTNGDEVWVNPIHVRMVHPDRGLLGTGGKGTTIWFGNELATGLRVSVVHTPRQVAEAINRAMPAILDINAATDDSDGKKCTSN